MWVLFGPNSRVGWHDGRYPAGVVAPPFHTVPELLLLAGHLKLGFDAGTETRELLPYQADEPMGMETRQEAASHAVECPQMYVDEPN
jgi:hypothetical protein